MEGVCLMCQCDLHRGNFGSTARVYICTMAQPKMRHNKALQVRGHNSKSLDNSSPDGTSIVSNKTNPWEISQWHELNYKCVVWIGWQTLLLIWRFSNFILSPVHTKEKGMTKVSNAGVNIPKQVHQQWRSPPLTNGRQSNCACWRTTPWRKKAFTTSCWAIRRQEEATLTR